jgi:hypothetical protein
MTTTLSSISFLTAVLALTAVASAQVYVAPNPGTFGYGGGYLHHSSTYEEGVQRGYAARVAAHGQANYLHSLAAINYQQARTLDLQNRKNTVDAYFYMRQANNSARAGARSERFTTEQYTALAKQAAPSRLSALEYDSTLGRLSWPAALVGDEFAAERDALDRVFRMRSPGDVGPSTDFYAQVRNITNSMQQKLRDNIHELDAAQYVAAKKFLLGVSYEASQSQMVRGLAMAH